VEPGATHLGSRYRSCFATPFSILSSLYIYIFFFFFFYRKKKKNL